MEKTFYHINCGKFENNLRLHQVDDKLNSLFPSTYFSSEFIFYNNEEGETVIKVCFSGTIFYRKILPPILESLGIPIKSIKPQSK